MRTKKMEKTKNRPKTLKELNALVEDLKDSVANCVAEDDYDLSMLSQNEDNISDIENRVDTLEENEIELTDNSDFQDLQGRIDTLEEKEENDFEDKFQDLEAKFIIQKTILEKTNDKFDLLMSLFAEVLKK